MGRCQKGSPGAISSNCAACFTTASSEVSGNGWSTGWQCASDVTESGTRTEAGGTLRGSGSRASSSEAAMAGRSWAVSSWLVVGSQGLAPGSKHK
eukprot:UN4974